MEYKYETHMHTSEVSACAVSSAAEQVKAYKERGYAGIIVTDHFVNGNSTVPHDMSWNRRMAFFTIGYERAKAEGNRIGIDVFFGWEFSIRGSDFLTYGLEPDFLYKNSETEDMEIEEYSALVRRNGGYLAQAHPYRKAWYIQNYFPAPYEFLDGIEVFNPSMPDDVNEQAFMFAEKHGLAKQSGTDSHSAKVPFPSGVILDRRAKDIHDIINALKKKKVKLIVP
jgi:hypothetical protein